MRKGDRFLKSYGEYGEAAARVTILLDEDAVIEEIWQVNDIPTHLQATRFVGVMPPGVQQRTAIPPTRSSTSSMEKESSTSADRRG